MNITSASGTTAGSNPNRTMVVIFGAAHSREALFWFAGLEKNVGWKLGLKKGYGAMRRVIELFVKGQMGVEVLQLKVAHCDLFLA